MLCSTCSTEKADLNLCQLLDAVWFKRLKLVVEFVAVVVDKFLEQIVKDLHMIVELSLVSRKILANFVMAKQL